RKGLETRLSQKIKTATMAAAAKAKTSAFAPAPVLNRPKLMPRLKVRARLKNDVTVSGSPKARSAKKARTAALLSWSRSTTTTAVSSPHSSISRSPQPAEGWRDRRLQHNADRGRCDPA